MAFLAQRSPPKNHSLFMIGKNCWGEGCKWLLPLLVMSGTDHLGTQNKTDPAELGQSWCLPVFLVKPMSKAVLSSPSPPFSRRKYVVPSSLLAWQPRPAVHRCAPSQQQQGWAHSKQGLIPWTWAWPAATNRERCEGHQTLHLRPPWLESLLLPAPSLQHFPAEVSKQYCVPRHSLLHCPRELSVTGDPMRKEWVSFFSIPPFFLLLFANASGRGVGGFGNTLLHLYF